MTLREEDGCVSHMDFSITTVVRLEKRQEVGGDNLTAFAVWKMNSPKERVREKQQSEKEDRKET